MRKSLLAALTALSVLGQAASGQVPLDADPGRAERTRADLEGLLTYYDEVLRSPVYSESVKQSVRVSSERIRSRLQEGDFRLGDRIALYVEGEPELPDTVSVEVGPRISLPLFGDISLNGVLRSEIQPHLAEQLGRFIRDPVVRAKALMRVSIQGAVGAPGYYVIPADMLLGEALMAAGGPAANADIEDLRIERGPQRVIDGQQLQDAMREGLTLDQLNLQAGDQIVMPERGGGFLANIGIITGLGTTIGFLAFQLIG
jgi:protein involved in polysaccharide export with SLBB domain